MDHYLKGFLQCILLVSACVGEGSWKAQTCSAGRRQSPVDFNFKHLQIVDLPPFIYHNYHVAYGTQLHRHDFKVTLEYPPGSSTVPSISGGGLGGRYLFSALHFHWSVESGRGSEHTLEGQQFDGEMHMVHYKESYGSLEEAMQHPDGVAVLGSWLREGEELRRGSSSSSPGYRWMQDAGALLQHDVSSLQDGDNGGKIALADLLPERSGHYFRYNGSLTTHPCTEAVVWTVFRWPSRAPAQFMATLRQLHTTVRRTQPLHDREVYYGGSQFFTLSAATTAQPLGLTTAQPLGPLGLALLPLLFV